METKYARDWPPRVIWVGTGLKFPSKCKLWLGHAEYAWLASVITAVLMQGGIVKVSGPGSLSHPGQPFLLELSLVQKGQFPLDQTISWSIPAYGWTNQVSIRIVDSTIK